MYEVLKDCQIPNLNSIYNQFFGFKKDGVFVEIGAFDGESISNTVFLADLGWKGIYVEPVKEYYEKCLQRHIKNDVKVFNCLVGDQECEKTIYKAGDISTSREDVLHFFNTGPLGWAHGRYYGQNEVVKQVTLKNILKSNNLKNIDVLVIDTEGNEWDIIKNFNFDEHNIKMLIIEMHETSQAWETCPSLIQDNVDINLKMSSHNYTKIFSDDINTIFVKNNL